MAIEKISIDIKSNAKDIEKQLKDIDSRIKDLKSSKPTIQLNAEKLGNAKKEINSVNVQLKELSAKKALIKADASNIEDAKKKMADITVQIDKLRARKAVLQVTTEKLKGADQDLKKLDREMQQLNNKKAYLQVDSQNIAETESKLSSLKSKLMQIGTTKTKIDISANLDKLGSQLDGIGNKMLGVFNPLGSKINQMIGLGAVLKGLDSAVNMVTGSIEGASTRLDIINNFPKVMSNMKISAEDAKEAMDMLGDNLTGLPTTLDEATLSVQRFTSKNKDVQKSTKMFLGLNNAILAGGASTDIQSSALEQLSQGYSKGKIDMMEWRSALTAMPAQMDQVAQAFHMSTDELGEGLRTGTTSMDEFMEKIMELNEEGANGFQSFADQAKNSVGGLRTSLKVMKSAVTRGVTSIIDTTDKILKNGGLNGIGGVFGKIGSTFETNLKKVSKLLEDNQEKIISFVNTAKIQFSSLTGNFDKAKFFEGMKEGFLSTVEAGKTFVNTMKPLINVAKNLITKFGDGSFEKGLGKLPALFLKAAIASKVLGKSLKLLSKLNIKLPSFGKGKDAAKVNPFESILSGLTGFAKNVGNLALVFGMLKVIEEAAQALKDINDKVPSNFLSLAPKLFNMGVALTAMGGLIAIAGKLAGKFKGQAAAGMLAVVSVSLSLMLAAEALNQINKKVPGSISKVASKIANIGIAIGGMSVLVGVVGALVSSGIGALIAGAGLATVALVAGELMLVAEAIKQMDDKVPENFSGVKKKIDNIVKVISQFTRANLGNIFDLFKNAVGAINTAVVVEGVKKMVDLGKVLEEFEKIEIPKNVHSKLKEIQKVFGYLKQSSGFYAEAFKFFYGGQIDTKIGNQSVTAVTALKDVAKAIGQIMQIDIGNPEDVKNKIMNIQSIFDHLKKADGLFVGAGKLFNGGKIDKFFVGGDIDTKTSVVAKEAIDNLVELSRSLDSIKNVSVDQNAVKSAITNLQQVFGYFRTTKGFWSGIGKFFGGGNIDTKISQTAKKAIDNLLDFAKMLVDIPEINTSEVDKRIKSVQKIFKSLEKTKGFDYDVSTFSFGGAIDSKVGKTAKTAVENLVGFAKTLLDLPEVNVTALSNKIFDIQSLFNEMLTTKGLIGDIGTYFAGGDIDATIPEKAQSYASALVGVVDSFKLLPQDFNGKAITKTINGIQDVFDSFIKKENILARLGSFFSGGDIDTGIVETAQKYITTLVEIADTLRELMPTKDKTNLNVKAIEKTIKNIQSVFEIFDKDKGLLSKGWDFVFGGDGLDTNIVDALDQMKSIAEKISQLSSIEIKAGKAQKVIANLKGALRLLKSETWSEFDKGFVTKTMLDNLDTSVFWLNNVGQKLLKLSENSLETGKVQGVIENIKGSLRMFRAESWVDFEGGFITKSLLDPIDTAVYWLKSIGKKLEALSNNTLEAGKAQDVIINLKGAMRMLKSERWFEFENGFVGKSLLDNLDTSVFWLNKVGVKLLKMSNNSLETGKAQDVIANIKGSLRMLKIENWEDFKGGFISKSVLDPLDTSIYWLKSIGIKLSKLAENTLESGKAQDVIANIKGALRLLRIESWSDYKNGFVSKGLLDKLDTSIFWLNSVGKKLLTLSNNTLETGKVQGVIENIKGALRLFRLESWVDFREGFVTKSVLDPLDTSIYWLKKVAERLSILSLVELDISKTNTMIAKIKGALRSFKLDAWSDFEDGFVGKTLLTELNSTVDSFMTLSKKIARLGDIEIDIVKVQTAITYIKGVIGRLSLEGYPQLNELISAKYVDSIDTVVYRFVTLAKRMEKFENVEFSEGIIFSKIESMRRIIGWLNDFPSAKGVDSAEELVKTFVKMANSMSQLSGNFNIIGKGYGEELIKGFKNANVPSTIISLVDKLIRDLKNKNSSFTAIGKGWGDALKNAFTSAISGLVNAVLSQINSLNAQSAAFATIGTSYGQFLTNGFNKSVSSLSESIGNQVKAIQTSLDNLKAPDLNVKVGTSGKAVRRSVGGPIPEYHATGGVAGVFKSKGTDTVPAMLTPGEFVQRKAAVNTFGLDFMNRVNNLDIQGVFQALTGRFNSRAVSRQSVSTVINNVNNSRTNNAKVVQNIHSDSQNYNGFKRIGRELRRI